VLLEDEILEDEDEFSLIPLYAKKGMTIGGER